MFSIRNIFKTKALTLPVTKTQRELLELLLANKSGFDEWSQKHNPAKIRFQFFYPAAIDFYYESFKLFTAYFKRGPKDEHLLQEFKMSETNFDTIRCTSWSPFAEVIIEFLTSLEEDKKIALFEKRKVLFEYQSLCARNNESLSPEQAYSKASEVSLPFLKPSH